MSIQTLSDRDLRALVKFGTDDTIIRRATNELTARAEREHLHAGLVGESHSPHLERQAGALPTKGRWDS